MPKETLRISHGELSIPPWPVPLFGRIDIPVPEAFADAAPLPEPAFDAGSGKLICLVEFDWEAVLSDSASKSAARFPHPNIMRDGLPVEFFSHQLFDLDLTDIDEVVEFCGKWGAVLAPTFSSKQRFIASRLHNKHLAKGDRLRYENTFPTTVPIHGNSSLEACLNAASQSLLAGTATNHEGLLDGLTPAVLASEYARRAFCRDKTAAMGGIVSCIEVVYTLLSLQNAVKMVIAADAAKGGVSGLAERLLSDEADNGWARAVKATLSAPETSLDVRKRLTANIIEPDLEQATSFVSLCLSSSGCLNVWHPERLRAPLRSGYEYAFVSLEPLPNDIESVWDNINPRYKLDPFYEGSLLEGICVQLVNTCNDSELWKCCGNKMCGRPFKYKQPSEASSSKQERKRAGLYCSDKCSNDWRNHIYAVENKIISNGVEAEKSTGDIIAELELTDEFYDVVPTGAQPGTPKQAQDQKKQQAEYERIKSRWLKKIEKARKR